MTEAARGSPTTTPSPATRSDYRQDDVEIEQMAGGGYDLCFIRDGEWVNYLVNVVAAGEYTATLRTASWGDGLYEDLNGNRAQDFNDVVTYFNQVNWIADYEPVAAFDVNRNGQIDFNDIVRVFSLL